MNFHLRPLMLPLLALLAISEIAPAATTRAAEASAVVSSMPLAMVKRFDQPSAIGSASAGSCTLVAKSATHAYWLTADHVTRDSHGFIGIYRPGKVNLAGSQIARQIGPDLAIIRTTAKTVDWNPVPIWPYKLNSRDYYAEGYASASFRDFGRRRGSLRGFNSRGAEWGFPSIPGESGGCVYTVHRKTRYLCGVVSASDWPDNPRGLRPGFTTGGYSYNIRAFLASAGLEVGPDGATHVARTHVEVRCGIIRRVFGGRNHPDPCPECLPQPGRPQLSPPQGFLPEDAAPLPPQDTAPSPPENPSPAPPAPTPPPTPSPPVERKELRVEVIGKPGPKGDPGAAGKPGADGKDGSDGRTPSSAELLALVDQALSMRPQLGESDVRRIAQEETSKLELNLQREMGALKALLVDLNSAVNDMATAEPTPELPTPTQPIRAKNHLVLVAPKKATYYNRLVEYYRKASQAFTPILMTEPDRYTGELPALVAYQDRIPIDRWLGQREVEEQLHRITRGDADSIFPD